MGQRLHGGLHIADEVCDREALGDELDAIFEWNRVKWAMARDAQLRRDRELQKARGPGAID